LAFLAFVTPILVASASLEHDRSRRTAPQPLAPPQKAALSRELGDFLIELSIALHKQRCTRRVIPRSRLRPQGWSGAGRPCCRSARRSRSASPATSSSSRGSPRPKHPCWGARGAPASPPPGGRDVLSRDHGRRGGRGPQDPRRRGRSLGAAAGAGRPRAPPGVAPRTSALPDLRAPGSCSTPPKTRQRKAASPKARACARPSCGSASPGRPGGTARRRRSAATKPAVIAQAIDAHPRPRLRPGDRRLLLQITEELKAAGGGGGRGAAAPDLAPHPGDEAGTAAAAAGEWGETSPSVQRFALDATHGRAVDAVLEIVRARRTPPTRASPTRSCGCSRSWPRTPSRVARRPSARRCRAARPRWTAAPGWSLDDPNPGSTVPPATHGAGRPPVPRPAESSVERKTSGCCRWG